jgi:CPA2 family monovalent cation:H+ antiporter-2
LFDTSFALGAFMAGFVLNESDIGKKMSNLALPLRDLFAVLFFIATGMVFNPAILIHETKLVLITFLLIVLIRPMIIFVLMRMLKQSKSDSLNMSFGLAQIGEFSFILGALALKIGNFSSVLYDLIIAGSILSIAVNFLLFKIKIIT